MVIAGQRVRIGLAGVDARDLDRLKVSLADAFEPCPNIQIAARLMSEDPGRLEADRHGCAARASAGIEGRRGV